MHQIGEPSWPPLLVGKTSRAGELASASPWTGEPAGGQPLAPPDAYVTILGNLIENAIEGLNQSPGQQREITVSIRESEASLLLCVEDTGPGIPAEIQSTPL